MQQESYNGGYAAVSTGGQGLALPFELDIGRILRTLLRFSWAILLSAATFAGALYYYSKVNQGTNYSAQATFALTRIMYVKEVRNAGTDDEVIVSYPTRVFYTSADENRNMALLHSDSVIDRIDTYLGNKYGPDRIRNSVRIAGTGVAAIFQVSVYDSDPTLCNEVLDAVIRIYPEYLTRFESTIGIEMIRRPNPAAGVGYGPNVKKMTLFGAVVGGGMIVALLVLLDLTKNTLRSATEVRKRTAERLLGMIPWQNTRRGSKKDDSGRVQCILDKRNVSFDFIENIKAIRTKIENTAADWEGKVFAFTSTFEAEGKTTLAINIACALAQKGNNVLLIDCDLRKSAVMAGMGLEAPEGIGLIPILKGAAEYESGVKYVKQMRFFVMPSGGATDNATELLGSAAMRRVIERARESFDYVLLDTPPARVVADCLAVTPFTDGIIYAIRYDYARIAQVTDTMDELSRVGAKFVGSVLTMAAADGKVLGRSYYGQGRRVRKYNGGFSYGYGHGAYGESSRSYLRTDKEESDVREYDPANPEEF
ncbi:MAG: polysaccharide biosynthesis tyrosine autokinase [Oscillospiraceae bacterium]|nr:polysaccharide biosynthesis tyrosine autokinase [Oscillospiraceae bacterium]